MNTLTAHDITTMLMELDGIADCADSVHRVAPATSALCDLIHKRVWSVRYALLRASCADVAVETTEAAR